MKKIDKKMTFQELFKLFPEKSHLIAEEFAKANLGCIGCSAAAFETIEEGLLSHGITEEEIDSFIDRLNKILSSN